MPCHPVKLGNGGYAIICGRSPRKKCFYCDKPGTILCDFQVGKKTCDRPTCREHAKNVGPDRDYCQEHAK